MANVSESFQKISNKLGTIYQKIYKMSQNEDFALIVIQEIALDIITAIEKAVNGDYELFSDKEKIILRDETQLNTYDISTYGIINLIFGIYFIAFGFTNINQFNTISKDGKYIVILNFIYIYIYI